MKEISCRGCDSTFRAALPDPFDSPVRAVCPVCSHQMILRPGRARRSLRAVIADESRPFRDFLVEQLAILGFDTLCVEDGREALDQIRLLEADLAIVNVYLTSMLGVEVSEEIRADRSLDHTRVILIGALFRANRFRANPTSLYGADEYIEDQVPVQELQKIIRKVVPAAGGGGQIEITDNREEEARRLARLILSDIVIYNSDKASRGIRDGNFEEILRDEISEGREYFRARVGPGGRVDGEIFDDTIEQFVRMKREELSEATSA